MASIPAPGMATYTSSDAKVHPAGSLPSVHAVYEDPHLHGRWTTQYPKRLDYPAEDAESAKHALVARYKLSTDPSKSLDLHSIVVQSPLLKHSLARVLDGYPGITTDLERLEFTAPFECFVHRWNQLCLERDSLIRQDPPSGFAHVHQQAVTHMKLLFSTLENELGAVIREKSDLVAHGVMKFDKLWVLFEPGCLVYHKMDGQDRVFKLKSTKMNNNTTTLRLFELDCHYVDYDGTDFGYCSQTIRISEFAGTKQIVTFDAYPVEFHEDSSRLKQELIERGQLFEAYKSHHFVDYDGIGIGIGRLNRGDQRFNVKSRVIVDGNSFARYNTKIGIERIQLAEPSPNAVDASGDSDDDCVMLDEHTGQKQHSAPAGKKLVITATSRFLLTPEQHLIAVPTVRGYSLRDKRWFTLFIASIKDISWNDDAFASLVAPQEQKDLLLSFADSHLKNRVHFDDFVQGKGKGIIMLLAGPPGVGKTLTAESVAETLRAPLFSVGAADLSAAESNPRARNPSSAAAVLENKLHDILEMCAKWNAVLLLDEADVFMEARSTSDLERNKLVSVFLRLLEYFSGLMFLTTNRLGSLDAAFESRIHLTLHYSELDKAARKQLWTTFLEHAAAFSHAAALQPDGDGPAGASSAVVVGSGFSDAEVERLSRERLNGRQIKNVIKTAGLLAARYGEGLGMRHLETVLRLRRGGERKSGGLFGGGE